MKNKETLTYNLNNISDAIDILFKLINKYKIFTFSGDLGSGKTTIIKKLLRKMGVTETVISPTYTYVTSYKIGDNKIIYHFDLYRLKTIQEFFDLGFDELICQEDSWSFIEWPEIILPILNIGVCHIFIDYIDHNVRKLTITEKNDSNSILNKNFLY